ncbi:MAG: hypothetical protein C0P74_006460 [Gammaproteobacteria bacterium]|nr:hypothetical protein [Gammaproteobacteria bacterium]
MSTADPVAEHARGKQRLRFELAFASVWLAIGLFALPALIYVVGILMLGPYGEGWGLGRFYTDFFKDLAGLSPRAWSIALGPLILITVLRLLFFDVRAPREDRSAASPPAPRTQRPASRAPRGPSRVEPRISLE